MATPHKGCQINSLKRLLEVVLRHYANAVCSVVCIAYVLARAVKILQCKGEVRRYVVEDVAEDILASLVLVVRECYVVNLKTYC